MNDEDRILEMGEVSSYCKCPNCEDILKPRTTGSGLYWCPKCLKGETAMLWISYGNTHYLAMERLEQLKQGKK